MIDEQHEKPIKSEQVAVHHETHSASETDEVSLFPEGPKAQVLHVIHHDMTDNYRCLPLNTSAVVDMEEQTLHMPVL